MLDKYGISGVPSLIITKQGTVIEKISNLDELNQVMKKYLIK